jgi:hypothetical protein
MRPMPNPRAKWRYSTNTCIRAVEIVEGIDQATLYHDIVECTTAWVACGMFITLFLDCATAQRKRETERHYAKSGDREDDESR